MKTTQEDFTKKMTELKGQMEKDLAGKSGEEAAKVTEDYSAKS